MKQLTDLHNRAMHQLNSDADTDVLKAELQCSHSNTCVNPKGDTQQGVSLKDRTVALVRGLRLVMLHHNASSKILIQMDDQVHRYLETSTSEGDWQSKVKDLTVYPMAEYLKNEPPVPKVDRFKPRFQFLRWWKNRLRVFSRRNTHFWYSWYQAKRSCLPASDDLVEKAYQDHLAALTKQDKGDTTIVENIFRDETFQYVLAYMKSQMFELMSTSDYRSPFRYSPSTNASWENTRSNGGSASALREKARIDSEVHFGEGSSSTSARVAGICFTELEDMIYVPRSYSGKVSNKVIEVRRSGRNDLFRIPRPSISGPLSCTIQAVLEPLKVRIISKGESLPYYYAKPLQKLMHTVCRQLPCFSLIGRPSSPTDLCRLLDRAEAHWKWFSVDYSAATDNLSYVYSGRIFEEIISIFPESEQEVFRAVLGFHKLHYPTGRRHTEFRGIMTTGQLMGSILSFPILCLANLGVYLLNTQELHKGWSHWSRLSHVLVNGDDMLYAAPNTLWARHAEISNAVGLELSVGKSYIHGTYANINSTSFHYTIRNGRESKSLCESCLEIKDCHYVDTALICSECHKECVVPDTPWQIDFLNAGLFFGQHKVQNREVAVAQAHIRGAEDNHVSVIPVLLKGSLPGKQKLLLSEYMSLHSASLKRECLAYFVPEGISRKRQLFVRNIFVPISYGGMGIEPPLYFHYKFTGIQRKVASCLLAANEEVTYLPIGPRTEDSFQCVPLRDWVVGPADVQSGMSDYDDLPVYRISRDTKTGKCREFQIPFEARASYPGMYLC